MFTEVPCDVQTCVEMYQSGHTLTEIGDTIGCSYMTVRRRLADAGVEIRKVGKQQQHCRYICLAMHEAGLTDTQIADTFGVNRTTVNKWLRSFEIKQGRGFASNSERASEVAKKVNDDRAKAAADRFLRTFADNLSDSFELLKHGKLGARRGTCSLRCKTCGHEFDRYVDLKYETTCPVCREAELRRKAEERKAIRVEADERKAAKLQVDRTCRECGATFHSEYENAAYCSPECRRKHDNKAANARHKRNGYSSCHRKRARNYGCVYDPSVNLKRLIERDGLTCYICGKRCDPNDLSWGTSGPNRPTLDHVVPLAKVGGHTWGNVKVCCGECNSAKRDLDVAEVLATA